MIFWKDFILDDVCGPVLSLNETERTGMQVCRRGRLGGSGIMEDARSGVSIQETEQEQRPARMVGHSFSAQTGMEAGGGTQAEFEACRQGEAR